tara:strand:- start:5 stop:286 length:282 start_codon:yes stop_codon:yes gene_type:complete
MYKIIVPTLAFFTLIFNVIAKDLNSQLKVSFTNSINNEPIILNTNPNIKKIATCFHKGERMSGMNKICYYDCLGSEYAITISSTSLCPLTINR